MIHILCSCPMIFLRLLILVSQHPMSLGSSKAYLIFSPGMGLRSPGLSYPCSSELEIRFSNAECLQRNCVQLPAIDDSRSRGSSQLGLPKFQGISTFFSLCAPGMYTVHLHRDRQNIYEHRIKISKIVLMIHCLF